MPKDALLGQVVSGYAISRRIGSGSTGRVYLATAIGTGRLVALKVLHKNRTKDKVAVHRFFREARAASALRHSNIVEIYETGEGLPSLRPFIAMEYLDGRNLAAFRRHAPPVQLLESILQQSADALAAVHAAGIVHRDLKPENLMLVANDTLKVVDFGLARISETTGGASSATAIHTRPGMLLGTLRYMAPERLHGKPALPSSDIFSLGVLLYEFATGIHPFAGETDGALIQAVLEEAPLPAHLVNRQITARISDLLREMLQKDPAKRPSAAEIASCADTPKRARVTVLEEIRSNGKFVGREKEQRGLHEHLETVRSGIGSVLWVGGEAGMGKSRLVEECLRKHEDFRYARGKCSERWAGGEAYAPVLDALQNLIRCENGSAAARVVRAVAPHWHAQLGGLEDGIDAPKSPAASQQRWNSEFVRTVEALAADRPLCIFLDDLHWADPCTINLMAFAVPRCTALRVSFVFTYRPFELAGRNHPLRDIRSEFLIRGVASELPMGFLLFSDVQQYVSAEFPASEFSGELARVVYRQSGGNPLFMAELVRYLRAANVVGCTHGEWRMLRPLSAIEQQLPETIENVIERKISRLSDCELTLLKAAAVQGIDFDSAVLAHALDREVEEVEAALVKLDRIYGFIEWAHDDDLPGGAITRHYAFIHVLYQQALERSLTPTERSRISLRVAEALSHSYEGKWESVASRMADLFHSGRDRVRSAMFFEIAARSALRLSAYAEAERNARRGLEVLREAGRISNGERLELSLSMCLGSALMATRTYGDEEVEAAYNRAQQLIGDLRDSPEYFAVMRSLWAFRIMRAHRGMGRDLAEELVVYTRREKNGPLLVEALASLGFSQVQLGEFEEAAASLQEALHVRKRERAAIQAQFFPLDQGVGCRAQLALNFWYLGHPGSSLAMAEEAIALATSLNHPYSLAFALMYCAGVHQLRREPEAVRKRAEAALAIAEEHGHAELYRWSSIRRGWAVAESGEMDAGILEMKRSLAANQASGSEAARPHFLCLMADAMLRGGRREEARDAVEEALETIRATQARCYLSEALRLKGDLAAGSPDDSEGIYHCGLAVAREQKCRGFELRLAVSLACLYRAHGSLDRGAEILLPVYSGFAEGLETGDLLAAREILESAGITVCAQAKDARQTT
jgi:tRNA A-37 threonylcarbamoyl transferase component Bud32/tetratricopeptide (TPR) repeat protein